LIVRLFNISDPNDRDINTSNPRPSLASHAPNVSKIILIATFGASIVDIINGIMITNLNIIPSNDNRAIKKCRWFDIRFSMPTKGIMEINIIIELFIELRVSPVFDLQDRCLFNLAFNSFK
jgi:hypothetical protein